MTKDLPIASWDVCIYVDCPGCGEYINLCDHETFWLDHPRLELASRDKIEVTCPLCDLVFNTQLEW